MDEQLLPRRGKKNARYQQTDADGNQVVLETDGDGVAWPEHAGHKLVADGHGLRIARKAMGVDDEDDVADEDDASEQPVEEPVLETFGVGRDLTPADTAPADVTEQTDTEQTVTGWKED